MQIGDIGFRSRRGFWGRRSRSRRPIASRRRVRNARRLSFRKRRMLARRKAAIIRRCNMMKRGLRGIDAANKSPRVLYLEWLKREHPNVFAVVKVRAPELVKSGLGDADAGNKKSSWSDTMMSIINAAVPIVQQNKIFKSQLKRAEKGYPPIDMKDVTPPGIPVRVELPKDIQAEVTSGLSVGKNMMLMGGLGLAAVAAVVILRNVPRGRKR